MSNINSIIVGSNNISIGSNAIIGGSNNISIGTCGSQGLYGAIGSTGLKGTAGPAGYQITDWKEELMKKYPRFTIKTEYDVMTFAPTNIIIDNNTKQEYKFQPQSISIDNETEQFIQQLIIEIREGKINDIINGTKS